MKICSIESSALRQIISSRASGLSIVWSNFESQIDVESDVSEKELHETNRRLVDIIRTTKSGADAERMMIPLVHQALRIPAVVAAKNGFWRWVSVKFFFETVQERHAGKSGLAHEGNFGGKGRFESLVGRLWFRGEIAREAGDDEYRLSMLGDQDFWRSHILRKRYSNDRSFVKQLIRFQYCNGGWPTLHPSSQEGIRTLTKRIQATHASRVLEVMSEASIQNVLERLSDGLQLSEQKSK